MSEFYKRLKSLRKERQKNQVELAELLGVTRATISAYETNKIMPPYDKLKMLADYFSVSVEYLTGQNDSKDAESQSIDVSESLRMLLNQLYEDSDLTVDGVELDKVSKELLVNSIENSLKLGKLLAQNKKE